MIMKFGKSVANKISLKVPKAREQLYAYAVDRLLEYPLRTMLSAQRDFRDVIETPDASRMVVVDQETGQKRSELVYTDHVPRTDGGTLLVGEQHL